MAKQTKKRLRGDGHDADGRPTKRTLQKWLTAAHDRIRFLESRDWKASAEAQRDTRIAELEKAARTHTARIMELEADLKNARADRETYENMYEKQLEMNTASEQIAMQAIRRIVMNGQSVTLEPP